MKNPVREYLLSNSRDQEEILTTLLEDPKESFDSLFSYRGPYPEQLGPQDVFPDLIYPLLRRITQENPELLLTRDLKQLKSGEREIFYRLAADSQNELCAPLLLQAFQDRSIAAKHIAIMAVQSLPSLQTQEVKELLEHLASLPSLDSLKEDIQESIACIEWSKG